MPFCPSCGAAANQDARFCVKCGHSLQTKSGAGVESQAQSRSQSQTSDVVTLKSLSLAERVVWPPIFADALRAGTITQQDVLAIGELPLPRNTGFVIVSWLSGGDEPKLGLLCDAEEFTIEKKGRVWKLEKAAAKSACFVATAVFDDVDSPQVMALRAFRDEFLCRNWVGRSAVAAYYRISPPIAARIRSSATLKRVTRRILELLIHCFSYSSNSNSRLFNRAAGESRRQK